MLIFQSAGEWAVRPQDAHLVALDARTGEIVWNVEMPDVYATNSGPLVANGLLIQGMGTCTVYEETKCFISAYDAGDGQAAVALPHVALDGEPGGDTWGGLPNLYRAGGETWITGSYDPDLNLTYWGTAQAKPWMPASRGMDTPDVALYTSSTLALDATPASSRGTTRTRPAKRSTSTSSSSACSSTPAARSGCSPSARTACCGSTIAGPASTSATRRRSSRTSGRASIRETGPAALPARHPRAQSRRVDRRVPEHRGRQELAGDELSPRRRAN